MRGMQKNAGWESFIRGIGSKVAPYWEKALLRPAEFIEKAPGLARAGAGGALGLGTAYFTESDQMPSPDKNRRRLLYAGLGALGGWGLPHVIKGVHQSGQAIGEAVANPVKFVRRGWLAHSPLGGKGTWAVGKSDASFINKVREEEALAQGVLKDLRERAKGVADEAVHGPSFLQRAKRKILGGSSPTVKEQAEKSFRSYQHFFSPEKAEEAKGLLQRLAESYKGKAQEIANLEKQLAEARKIGSTEQVSRLEKQIKALQGELTALEQAYKKRLSPLLADAKWYAPRKGQGYIGATADYLSRSGWTLKGGAWRYVPFGPKSVTVLTGAPLAFTAYNVATGKEKPSELVGEAANQTFFTGLQGMAALGKAMNFPAFFIAPAAVSAAAKFISKPIDKLTPAGRGEPPTETASRVRQMDPRQASQVYLGAAAKLERLAQAYERQGDPASAKRAREVAAQYKQIAFYYNKQAGRS